MAPMSAAPPLLTKAQGAVIATRPASMPLTSMLGVRLAVADLHVEHRRERAGRGRQHRVHRGDGNAQVGAGER